MPVPRNGRARRASLLTALAALAPLACGGSAPGRPDVVLISVDTLRADHLGLHGYPRDTSPRLDAFAREALVFERCFAHAPETRPSVASMLTGFLPHETRALDTLRLVEAVETLPERLQEVGYATRGVVGNYVLASRWGFDQGFDLYDDTMEQREAVRRWPERTARHTTDRAIELLELPRGGPLFLWVHYQDPHGPYTPPPEHLARFPTPGPPQLLELNEGVSGRGGIPSHQAVDGEHDYHRYVARYDAEIRFMDAELGRLFDALREQGLLERALIVFTADHGEGMGEHDYYFAHLEVLYRDITRVPLIVKQGDTVKGRSKELAQHLDIVPTVLAAAGLAPDPRLRGRDLRGGLGRPPPVVPAMKFPVERWSVVMDGLHLIESYPSRRPRPPEIELYDLESDPAERVDLHADPDYAERRRRLHAALARVREEDALRLAPGRPVPLTDEERAHLEALGYLR